MPPWLFIAITGTWALHSLWTIACLCFHYSLKNDWRYTNVHMKPFAVTLLILYFPFTITYWSWLIWG